MLYEFCLAGWNLDDRVGGKEKFGGLRCYAFSEDEKLNTEIQEIIRKYEYLSVKTCEKCGSAGKLRVVNGWDITLCINHYIKDISVIHIKDDSVFLNDGFLFKLSEIKKIDTLNSFRGMQVYLSGDETYISLNVRNPNYYLLLRSLPLHLFSEEDGNKIRLMFENLEDCEICGYKALWKDHCLRCNEEPWQESLLEDYEDKTEYVKRSQMLLFMDQDSYEEVSDFCDRSFEKTENYRILFNEEEFKEFEKDW
ncbi:hypothetical protein FY557_11915 [Chryseobacterium sp. SN22]|uniref:hypothetical protein n=1 Tax=Chryseobacterium sp. SN22 TaxID=2606431 RepID=UPI0011EDAC80|nr:hypothetical protein [Chryseobacterium sp. SN22]KAA0127588.1 hypothetical protein FY557_11915 [Chryseobacterium sp. SN22]